MDPSVDRVEILCPRCGEGFVGGDVELAERGVAQESLPESGIRCPHCGSAIPLEGLAESEDDLIEALRRD